MPEKLNPCPACGSKKTKHIGYEDEYYKKYFVFCIYCGMRGPHCDNRFSAIAAWNSLPRAPRITPNDADCKGCPERRLGLVWGTESPTVPGWYWQRLIGRENTCTMAWITLENKKLRCKSMFGDRYLTRFKGFEWAGPIPIPEEPVS